MYISISISLSSSNDGEQIRWRMRTVVRWLPKVLGRQVLVDKLRKLHRMRWRATVAHTPTSITLSIDDDIRLYHRWFIVDIDCGAIKS